ncbi:hypothetical protein ADJ73_12860 [Arsenicicoccus sp. oral taxon 190]|nr:hypothetical protein ADJ73_12860 [Arsenicicoccus sp. oral taxon 190]
MAPRDQAPVEWFGYQYLVLRCVPRVQREEFVNVGVVLYSQDAGFLDAVVHVDEARLRALCADLDLDALRSSLATVQAVCRGEAAAGLPEDARPWRRFGWLEAPRSTVLQPSRPHGGVTRDPAAELTGLVDRLVR